MTFTFKPLWFLLGVAIGLLWLHFHANASDRFVSLLEQREGMRPGQTRVIPECGCTIRYNGTTVSGNHYAVHIDRLD